MFSSANKTTKISPAIQQTAGTTFFRKAGEESFFGTKESPSFFKPAIQAKLTVSTPDDPQEKEADAVAEKVMRMPEPVAAAPLSDQNEEKIKRKEEEEIQAKQESPLGDKIQCKEEPGIKVQAKSETCSCGAKEDTNIYPKFQTENSTAQTGGGSLLYPSDVMRQSGRGPPTSSVPFEQTLASSKGGGSALPGDTQTFMESRFNADFSGVRVHTNSTAESLSRSVNAQAFAHGNDIYFNSGKFSPDSTVGKTLLAHELTHTVQQGASKNNASNNISGAVARKNGIHRNVENNGLSSIKENTLERKPNDRKDEIDVQQKEVTEQAYQNSYTENTLQPKPALSHFSVNANGSLHQTSHDLPVSKTAKEKEPEKKEENESTIDAGHTIQKKADDELNANPEKGNEVQPAFLHQAIQAKPFTESFTSINTEEPLTVKNNIVQERGPPVQRRPVQPGNIHIQRSPLDIALAHTGEILSGMPGIDDLMNMKDFLLGKMRRFASYIPGYRALGVVLGQDPITGDKIDQNGRNFIEAGLDIIPGGNLLKQKLDELGIIDRAAAWIDTQIVSLKGIVEGVRNEFRTAWDNLTDITSPIDVLRNIGGIIERAVNNVIAFARRAAGELLDMVKKFLLTHIVTFIKQHTSAYELLKVILEKDPITEERIERNGTNILNALLELGGDEGREQRKQMQETGTFQKAVGWIDRGIAVFGNLYATIRGSFSQIWNVVSIESLMHPVDTFNRIYETFAAPVTQVLQFVKDALVAILGFIKEALMGRLSTWAKTVKGYSLVTVIIGKDPFTNQTVPRSVENMIHGFMSLMDGGEEQFNQMKSSGAIAKAEQRVMAAVTKLNMTPAYVVQLFIQIWNSFSFADLANPIAAFQRILARFGEPIGRLIAFVIEIIRIVIDILLQIMQFPSDLIGNIIAKAMLAIEMIKRDPIGFLKNLLRAIKQGFMQFFGNIIRHLVAGLKDWFLGEVRAAGIPIPTDFTVMGIIKWLLVVLDITMEKIWKKLEERIGKEKVDKIRRLIDKAEQIANAAGEAYEFVQDVKKRGFMTVIVEKIKEKLSNAWDMVLDSIKSFIMDKVVSKAMQKVLSMLDPTGIMAVINSAIALYKAIQSFIRYLKQMLEMVNSFVEGTLEIAKGATKKAADSLEGSLARGVPIVIGFLANQVGLDLSGSLKDALAVVRKKVDIGLTWVIGKLVTIIEKLVEIGKSAVESLMNWLGLKNNFKSKDGGSHQIFFSGNTKDAIMMVASNNPKPVEIVLNEKKSTDKDANEAYDYYINSVKTQEQTVQTKELNYKAEADKEAKRAARYQHQLSVEELRNRMMLFSEKLSLVTLDNGNENLNVKTKIIPMTDGTRAKSVTVLPLTYLPGDEVGSPPFEEPAGWKNYAQNSSEQWVRGHLLSEHLHGPGRKWNLVPLIQKVNSNMASVEEKIIPLIAQQGKLFYYKTTVTYDDTRTDLNAKNIPTSISMEYGESENNNGQYQVIDSTKKSSGQSFQQDPPNFGGPPNLNDIGEVAIEGKFSEAGKKDKASLARDIVMCRDNYEETDDNFLDFNDLINKMYDFYQDKLIRKKDKPLQKKVKQYSQLHGANFQLLYDIIVKDKKMRIE